MQAWAREMELDADEKHPMMHLWVASLYSASDELLRHPSSHLKDRSRLKSRGALAFRTICTSARQLRDWSMSISRAQLLAATMGLTYVIGTAQRVAMTSSMFKIQAPCLRISKPPSLPMAAAFTKAWSLEGKENQQTTGQLNLT